MPVSEHICQPSESMEMPPPAEVLGLNVEMSRPFELASLLKSAADDDVDALSCSLADAGKEATGWYGIARA